MTRTIHTNLYSDSAFDILKAVHNCIDSEHLRRIDGRNADCCTITRAPDNEVTIEADYVAWRRSIFRKFQNNDQEILNYFAWVTKELLRKYCNNNTNDYDFNTIWKRTCTRPDLVSECYGIDDNKTINISDVYMFYELLRNRCRVDRRYNTKKLAKMRGEMRDPISTEQERIRREEEKKIMDKYEILLKEQNFEMWGNKMYTQYRRELEKAQNEIYNKFKKMTDANIAEIKRQRENDIKTLNETLGLIIA